VSKVLGGSTVLVATILAFSIPFGGNPTPSDTGTPTNPAGAFDITIDASELTLMTAPLGIPELRELLVDHRDGKVAQAILRVGYGPPTAPSSRRPLRDVLMTAAVAAR
jgi:hypothetical protein